MKGGEQMGRISMPQGKGSQLHNRREYEKIGREIPDNIDVNLSCENITLVDCDIKKAYEEIFGKVLQEYNSRQKRADRKIDNYYEHIKKSKNGEKLFYEDVLQWGKKEDFENDPLLREKAKNALIRYAEGFQERNPNLIVIGAYIHMDEASPHLHLDYVPIAHGYTRGLKTRNSLDKAMKEMGFVPEKESRVNNATRLWKESERAYFGEICRNIGLDVEIERKSTRGSLSVAEYKEAKEEMLGEIQQELEVLENKKEQSKEDMKFWEGQSDLYMEKAIANRDEAFALEEKKSQLREKIENQEIKLAANTETLEQQENKIKAGMETIEKVDTITNALAESNVSVKLKDMVIPERKSIFGKVEEPAKKGVFVENMTPEQVQAMILRGNAKETIESQLYRVQEHCNRIIEKAHADAKQIRSEATAEKNETIAEAEKIVNQEQSILSKSKQWVEDIKKRYQGLLQKVQELLSRKEQLENEIAIIEGYKGELEPLRKEVEELTRAKKIMSGELDYEITKAKFREWSTMPFGTSYSAYIKSGELLALYKDGRTRQVTFNENGGMDYKTLSDQKNGLCMVGIMQEEERVRVPKSVLKELIQARDKEKPISANLENLIKQQTQVDIDRTRTRGRSR